MTWRHLYGRAEVSINDPQPFATCDRCSIQYNQADLSWQFQITGRSVTNTRLLVCRFCRDELAEFLVPQILPSDPEPIFNARPEQFAIDEDDFRITEEEDQRITEDDDRRVLDSSASQDVGED